MRLRFVLMALAGLAGVVAAGPGAGLTPAADAAQTSTSGASGRQAAAQLSAFSCTRALDPVSRAMSTVAVMRPVPGTRAMAIRFRLLERAGGAAPVDVVRAGDLNVWISPAQPGLGQRPADVWRLAKTVVDLPAPASYRFEVQFRWTGTAGRVLAWTERFTRGCRQLELRPDLLVRSFTAATIPGDASHDEYTAVIADRGLTAAGPFEVLFNPGDGSRPLTATIPRLGPGRSRVVRFTGPLCQAGSAPTVTADAAQQVDDLDRSNNTATATCPASEPTSAGG